MNRGGIGARSLNIGLQAERFGWNFAAGDKVMQVENDYEEVYNGDILATSMMSNAPRTLPRRS
jgi:exodeoxyribonuclease V alpha subunit